MLEPKDILSTDRLLSMANEVSVLLKVVMTGDDPDAYVNRANELIAWMATTGKMLADAKYHRDLAMKGSIINLMKDTLKNSLPTSAINSLIKSDTAEINYLVNWIEQIDKEVKYNIELLRTLISYAKVDKLNQYTPQ